MKSLRDCRPTEKDYPLTEKASYKEYVDLFIQRIPRFILKMGPGKRWRTINKPLGDRLIQAHLGGSRAVGALGKWYPGHAILDIDKQEVEQVQEMRSAAGLTESNSMLCSSESEKSYHLLLRPVYHNTPPTVKLLNDIFKPFCGQHGVEIYPRSKKCVRLPFGKVQQCLDEGMETIDSWEKKTYWFQKLDEYDLASVPNQQLLLELEPLEKADSRKSMLSTFQRGQELFVNGLQASSSRHDSQFEVLYYLWRKNVPLGEAEGITWTWIGKKHNGYSKDIVSSPVMVKKEIERQASRIWGDYSVYPDSTHNVYHGYVTKADIVDVLKVSEGSLPEARFLFNLIKYYYPRRHRDRINVHSDLLKSWASEHTYLDRIRRLERKGIAYRGKDYLVDVRAKEIKLEWSWRSLDDAILVDDRAPETLEDSIRAAFTEEEARALFQASGMRHHISRYVREIFFILPFKLSHNIQRSTLPFPLCLRLESSQTATHI